MLHAGKIVTYMCVCYKLVHLQLLPFSVQAIRLLKFVPGHMGSKTGCPVDDMGWLQTLYM